MKPPRRWIDLSFLKLRSLRSETEANVGIHEAHISFALSGSDHERWTAFAFVDTAFDDEELDENLSSGEGVGFHQDPIASDPWIQANHPIWDPREYFLAIFELRIAQVAREWQYLVRKVEQSVKEYVCCSASSCFGILWPLTIHLERKAFFNFIAVFWAHSNPRRRCEGDGRVDSANCGILESVAGWPFRNYQGLGDLQFPERGR